MHVNIGGHTGLSVTKEAVPPASHTRVAERHHAVAAAMIKEANETFGSPQRVEETNKAVEITYANGVHLSIDIA